MKPLLFTALFLLTNCAAWEEMGQTGELPETTVNRSKAVMSAYCDGLIIGNVNRIAVRFMRAVFPDWESSCERRAEQQ